jgi:hypothetical protein
MFKGLFKVEIEKRQSYGKRLRGIDEGVIRENLRVLLTVKAVLQSRVENWKFVWQAKDDLKYDGLTYLHFY